MRAWDFLKNRAVVASLGAVLIFGVGATFAVSQLTQRATLTGQSSAASSTATAGAGAAATDTATTGSGSGSAPTATPSGATPSPTATNPSQQPTPTSAPTGQQGSVQGTIGTVYLSSNKFTVNTTSGIKTVFVDGNTHYQGSSSSLAGLKSGWQVEVQGILQSGDSLLATDVNSDNGA